jgi:hypothetical protein
VVHGNVQLILHESLESGGGYATRALIPLEDWLAYLVNYIQGSAGPTSETESRTFGPRVVGIRVEQI